MAENIGAAAGRVPWSTPETTILTLEDVNELADLEVAFASSSCANSSDVAP